MSRVICSCFIYAEQTLHVSSCRLRFNLTSKKIRYIILAESIFFLRGPAYFRIFQTFEKRKAGFRLEGAFAVSQGFHIFFLSFVYYIFFARYSISSLQKLLKCKRWKIFFSVCLFHSLRGVSSHTQKKNEISRNKILFFSSCPCFKNIVTSHAVAKFDRKGIHNMMTQH